MKNVLWLASWYPNRLDNFDGDFIQRHAKAVALYAEVHVIYVKKDDGLAANSVFEENHASGNLTEQVIYYNAYKTGIKPIDRLLSHLLYKKHFRNAVKKYINRSGKPELVHVHVAMKAGLAALWIKKKWEIPYLVTEHWTAYLPGADKQLKHYPVVFKKMLQRVLDHASALSVVSDHLGRSIQNYFPALQYAVIPNVVDTNIFFPVSRQKNESTRFIHISNMNYQKNTEAIIEALHLLKNGPAFEMYLFGPVNDNLQKLVSGYQMGSCVFLKGEIPQPILAETLQQSDALILYSRFETFGCVLIEANASGIPVVVSDLEVFHEIIEEGVNGLFVEGENVVALAEKLREFIAQKNKFDHEAIAASAAEKYNFKKVGRRFVELYDKLLVDQG